jgi:hypothetical protein
MEFLANACGLHGRRMRLPMSRPAGSPMQGHELQGKPENPAP